MVEGFRMTLDRGATGHDQHIESHMVWCWGTSLVVLGVSKCFHALRTGFLHVMFAVLLVSPQNLGQLLALTLQDLQPQDSGLHTPEN